MTSSLKEFEVQYLRNYSIKKYDSIGKIYLRDIS